MVFRSVLSVVVFLWCGVSVHAEPARTWHTVAELSETERAKLDLRTDTPRDSQILYLPAEKYPFEPPYTAEEMGYRAMEFSHFPRWSCAVTDTYGSITSSGYLQEAITEGVVLYMPEEGLAGYLYATSAGQEHSRWLFRQTAPPEDYDAQQVWISYRTDQTFPTRTDFFLYSPSLRRVRRMPQPRREDRFPKNVQTMDDFLGRDAWEFSWRFLGTDVLYETVRFPNTRSTVTLIRNGTLADIPIKNFKMLGDKYP